MDISSKDMEKNDRRQHSKESPGETADLFQTLTEKSVAGIYVVQDGKFVFVNANAAYYAGYTRDELIGKKSDILVPPEDRETVKKNARMLLQGERISPHEFQIIAKDGQRRWIMETVASISYEGKPAILGNSMDISARKQAEERIKESENWYRTVFETTGAATMVLENDTTISFVNNEFVKQFGYTKEEIENRKSWTEFTYPDDVENMKTHHNLRRIDPHIPPKNYEFRWYDKKGDLRNIYLTVDMIPGTTKSIASFLDSTDYKRAEATLKKRGEELEAKTHELEELNAALRVLLKKREEDKKELAADVLSNVKKLVIPYVDKLKKQITDPHIRADLKVLESNLRDIISPFSHTLSSQHMNLTAREIQVANLIKEGKSSKEIADFFNITSSAINICRHRIRHKLGLNKQKTNLQSYLSSFS